MLMFVVRDYDGNTPVPILSQQLLTTMEDVWKKITKPADHADDEFQKWFDFGVSSLPHPASPSFEDDAVVLSKKFLDREEEEFVFSNSSGSTLKGIEEDVIMEVQLMNARQDIKKVISDIMQTVYDALCKKIERSAKSHLSEVINNLLRDSQDFSNLWDRLRQQRDKLFATVVVEELKKFKDEGKLDDEGMGVCASRMSKMIDVTLQDAVLSKTACIRELMSQRFLFCLLHNADGVELPASLIKVFFSFFSHLFLAEIILAGNFSKQFQKALFHKIFLPQK